MAMDNPWPWTVHGHGPSVAMDRPWPWPGPAQKARRLLYKLTTPILYKLTAPILYKLTAPMTKHKYRADIMGVPRAAF